jgi:magnesium-transporting ATPase (P-type)
VALASLQGRKSNVDLMQERIERDLELLAATAIEDELQDGVGDTFDALRHAGVQRVCVLTGDKVETAYNIGIAARVIDEKLQDIMILGEDYLENLEKSEQWHKIDDILEQISNKNSEDE